MNWFIMTYFDFYSISSHLLSPRLLPLPCYFYFPFNYHWTCCTSLCLLRQMFHIFLFQTNSPRFFWPSSLLGFTQLTWNVWFSLNKRVDYFITSFNALHRPETDFRWRHKKLEMSSTFKFMYQEDPLNRAADIS